MEGVQSVRWSPYAQVMVHQLSDQCDGSPVSSHQFVRKL